MCPNQPRRFAVAAVPGAQSYQWTLPDGFTIAPGTPTNGPAVTLVPRFDIADGDYTLRVAAGSGSCGNSAVTPTTFRLGSGTPQITSNREQGEICAFNTVSLYANSSTGGSMNCEWSTDTGMLLYPNGTGYMEVRTPGPGQSMTVSARVVDACGNERIGYAFFFSVEQRSDGIYCSSDALPRIDVTKQVVYPNPADASLTIRQPAGTHLTIYNSQGRGVYRGRATEQPIEVDTRAWPEGLYFLHTRAGKDTQRYQIRIQHF